MEDEGKFFAPVASAHIGFARACFQDLGELRQDGITVQVPVRVVDLLEVVEVDHEECDRVVVPAGPLHLLKKLLGKRSPVGQLGQLVGQGVLLLSLEKLRMPDRNRGLRRDAVQEVRLVLRQLTPGVEVELHRPHELA